MGEPIEWNNSALSCLEDCGERFRRRYVEKEYAPRSPRMLRGTIVHRVASGALLRKMIEASLPSVEEARDLAADEFAREWASGVLVPDEDIAEAGSVGAVEGKTKDFAVDLSGYHVATVAPVIQPVAIERKITVKPKDSDLVIHGTIDLIDATPTGEVIRDLKTSEKTPPRDTADRSQQLSLYATIRLAEVGTLPERLTLDYLVRTPVRAEKKHVPLDTTRDMEDVRAVVARINVAVEAVKRGIFVPAAPDSWRCTATYCEFFRDCLYIRRGDRPRT